MVFNSKRKKPTAFENFRKTVNARDTAQSAEIARLQRLNKNNMEMLNTQNSDMMKFMSFAMANGGPGWSRADNITSTATSTELAAAQANNGKLPAEYKRDPTAQPNVTDVSTAKPADASTGASASDWIQDPENLPIIIGVVAVAAAAGYYYFYVQGGGRRY